MITNKWIITEKHNNSYGPLYTYNLVFVGEANYPQKCVVKTDFNMSVGEFAMLDASSIEPIDNIYNSPKNKIAQVKLATCRDFYKKESIKITLFGVEYGIFEGVIQDPQSNMKLKRGDIVKTALWKKPDNSVELHIIKNLTSNMQYINDERVKYTQEMVVLDADMAGAFDGTASYKHLLVGSYSGTYSVKVPSTSSFFSVHEKDEVLVLDNQRDRWFEILDNKTINDVISKYVRQK